MGIILEVVPACIPLDTSGVIDEGPSSVGDVRAVCAFSLAFWGMLKDVEAMIVF